MSLFEEAGKKFEEAKQSITSGADVAYVCRSCEERVEENHDHCPHCGAGAVEAVESEDS